MLLPQLEVALRISLKKQNKKTIVFVFLFVSLLVAVIVVTDLYVFSYKAVPFEVVMDKETTSNFDASGIAAALQNLN